MKWQEGMVSFLIPCYNHEKLVADCLNSILAQSYTNYEVIICDDASKDQSVEMIKKEKIKFDQRGIRFELLESETNRGITPNLNRMLALAKGEYVKIIASDDMLHPLYLEKMIACMKRNDRLQMVFSNCMKVTFEATYEPSKECMVGKQFEQLLDCSEGVLERVYLCNTIPAPALMIKREIYDQVGMYDESIGIEDLEMSLRILSYQENAVAGTDECLVYYRMNPNSITSTAKSKGVKKRMKFMHDNTVAIAKKYRKNVSKQAYKARMKELNFAYLYNRIQLLKSK